MTAPVYLSINEFPGDGVTTQFEFNFAGGYISRDHVKASVSDALGGITPVIITTGMWVNDYTLNLGVSAPVGGKVRIYRDTPRSEPLVNFEDGARITEANLDLLARQTVLAAAEAFDAGAYATVNDLLGAAGAAAAAAEQAETNAAASEAAAAASAIAASAARIAAELAETNAEAAANDPRVQVVNDSISDIQTCATNIAAILAAPGEASAAAISASAAAVSADDAAVAAAAAIAAAPFPSGTRMLFAQSTAPVGWTKDTTHNNKALRVVTGTAGSGGSVAFTTAFASQAVSGTVGNTTLTTAQMPSHGHAVSDPGHSHGSQSYRTSSGSVQFGGTGANMGNGSGTSSATTGISIAANGGSGAHNHAFIGTAIDLAVQYVDVIIAQKD